MKRYYLAGTVFVLALTLLNGCDGNGSTCVAEDEDGNCTEWRSNEWTAQDEKDTVAIKGILLVIKETSPGNYIIENEVAATTVKVIIKHADGTTEVLTEQQAKDKYYHDRADHPYVANGNNMFLWWYLYNSNFGYFLGRTTPPDNQHSKLYMHPSIFSRSMQVAPSIAKGVTGSAKIGVPASPTARSGFFSARAGSIGS